MSIRLGLLIVVRAVVSMWAMPLDPTAEREVNDYLATGGNVDTVELFHIGRLTLSDFAVAAPDIQFDAVKDPLWQDIISRAQSSADAPDSWSIGSTLFDLAEWLINH